MSNNFRRASLLRTLLATLATAFFFLSPIAANAGDPSKSTTSNSTANSTGTTTAAAVANAPSGKASAAPVYAAAFKDFDRQLQPLSQWKDEFMVVYFWATWCKSCRAEVPELIALHEKYKDKGVVVVGNSIDNTDKVKAFAKEYQIPYPLLIGSQDAMDLSKKMGNKVGGLPFTIMVNSRGEVVKTILGELPHGQLEEILVALKG
ncbi:MAG: TlpA family protein disulfide reductase [Prolixibacteraceae bacterium]|nr:TlpA family protein disulfide reductase [Burkholderiales bacterium]